MKTKQIGYLESVKSDNWMKRNLDPQKRSGFIREAVATKIQLDKERKNRSKK